LFGKSKDTEKQPVTDDRTPDDQALAMDYKLLRQHVRLAPANAQASNLEKWSGDMVTNLREAQTCFDKNYYADGPICFVQAQSKAKEYGLALNYKLWESQIKAFKAHEAAWLHDTEILEKWNARRTRCGEDLLKKEHQHREYFNSLEARKAELNEARKTAVKEWDSATKLPKIRS